MDLKFASLCGESVSYTHLGKKDSVLPYAGQTLHVYNWGEYTGENILREFEEKTGAKVVMENFDSNEQMYIKVANGESYDILVPSDYMIQRLIQEGYLQKLDPVSYTHLILRLGIWHRAVGLPRDFCRRWNGI